MMTFILIKCRIATVVVLFSSVFNKMLTSGFSVKTVASHSVCSSPVLYTSQWNYTTLHTRTSFTTGPPGQPPAGDRLRVVPVAVGGRRTAYPRQWPSVGLAVASPSWDLDKQPFVFVDAFVSQCGDLPTASTWTHGLAVRLTLFLTYLFSASASRLIPLLCPFYFSQRSKSKWRKAILQRHSGRSWHRTIHWNLLHVISAAVMHALPVSWISSYYCIIIFCLCNENVTFLLSIMFYFNSAYTC